MCFIYHNLFCKPQPPCFILRNPSCLFFSIINTYLFNRGANIYNDFVSWNYETRLILERTTINNYHFIMRPAGLISIHDDVIKWKHISCYCPFVTGIHRSLMDSPHKGQWRGTLMFYLICAWTNGWANNRNAGYLSHHLSVCRHCNGTRSFMPIRTVI